MFDNIGRQDAFGFLCAVCCRLSAVTDLVLLSYQSCLAVHIYLYILPCSGGLSSVSIGHWGCDPSICQLEHLRAGTSKGEM